MENFTVTIQAEKIAEALNRAAEDVFKSSYSNPLRDVFEKAVKDKEGELKKIIDEIIANTLTNPEFKSKISDTVIQGLVNAVLKR